MCSEFQNSIKIVLVCSKPRSILKQIKINFLRMLRKKLKYIKNNFTIIIKTFFSDFFLLQDYLIYKLQSEILTTNELIFSLILALFKIYAFNKLLL